MPSLVSTKANLIKNVPKYKFRTRLNGFSESQSAKQHWKENHVVSIMIDKFKSLGLETDEPFWGMLASVVPVVVERRQIT